MYFESQNCTSLKTGKLISSASCRGFNSLQNPIYGYVYEFNFSIYTFKITVPTIGKNGDPCNIGKEG